MKDRYRNGHPSFGRPKEWDEKYGPWGTPPDYTPPMTATTNIQSPLGLRIGSIFFAICSIAGIGITYLIVSTAYPVTGKIIFCLIVLLGVCPYMAWWCFRLAKLREAWMHKKAKCEQEQTEGQS